MKLIINGALGRMGQIVSEKALARGDVLAARVDARGAGDVRTALPEAGVEADALIDFSSHLATGALMNWCRAHRMPAVVCTTGQTDAEMAEIEAAGADIPVFLSANMSIGVALLADLAVRAARMLPGADIEIIERHHNKKLDVPSGTALLLARRIGEARPEAFVVTGRHENGLRRPGEIGIHSLRYGNEVGTHEIVLSTGNETITLKHEAENRSLFADGALAAAHFLAGRPAGLYDMRDMLA